MIKSDILALVLFNNILVFSYNFLVGTEANSTTLGRAQINMYNSTACASSPGSIVDLVPTSYDQETNMTTALAASFAMLALFAILLV